MENYVIEMNKIKKSYYGTMVLHDISLKLKAGEIVGLVGENGAGIFAKKGFLKAGPAKERKHKT